MAVAGRVTGRGWTVGGAVGGGSAVTGGRRPAAAGSAARVDRDVYVNVDFAGL